MTGPVPAALDAVPVARLLGRFRAGLISRSFGIAWRRGLHRSVGVVGRRSRLAVSRSRRGIELESADAHDRFLLEKQKGHHRKVVMALWNTIRWILATSPRARRQAKADANKDEVDHQTPEHAATHYDTDPARTLNPQRIIVSDPARS